MVTIAHALKPLGYRCFDGGHMHWRDPEIDTGYESSPNNDWQDALPKISPGAPPLGGERHNPKDDGRPQPS